MIDDSTAIGIATILGEKIYDRADTFSFIYCPLIYNALYLRDVAISHSWTIFRGTEEEKTLFQDYSLKLSRIPGWIRYATFILTEYDYEQNKHMYNNEFDENIFNEMVRIKQQLNL